MHNIGGGFYTKLTEKKEEPPKKTVQAEPKPVEKKVPDGALQLGWISSALAVCMIWF